MDPKYIRAFFALDMPAEQKRHLSEAMAALQEHLEKSYKPREFRWVKPVNLHITLQFMARVKEDELASLLQQVRSVVGAIKPFNLQLGQVEWFPSTYLPRVLSIKTDPHEALAELSSAVGKGIVASEYPIENRPFRGHLTLARIQGLHHVDPEYLSAFAWPSLPEVLVNEIVLFKSESQKGGSVYTRLAGIELSDNGHSRESGNLPS